MLQFNFNPFPVLHTDRLVLRGLTLSDLEAFHRLRSDENVLKYLDRAGQSLEEARDLLEKVITGASGNENITWGISLANDPTLIGTIGFWRTEPAHYRAEIGYMLMPKYWNAGLMTEAMRTILVYGFDKMKLHSVEAVVNPNNAGSIRLLEKFGFEREGYFRENYYFNGQFLDSGVYSLLHRNMK